MNTEQERAEFEAEIRENWGFAKLERAGGDYIDPETQGLWGLWNARAALQSQDREDAERMDWLESVGSVDIVRTLDNKTEVYAPDNDLIYAAAGSLRAAIDHARRVEGDGE